MLPVRDTFFDRMAFAKTERKPHWTYLPANVVRKRRKTKMEIADFV